jgi:hypothetical protein
VRYRTFGVAATGDRSVPWREAGADMGGVLLAANVDEGPEEDVFVGWRIGTNLTLSVKNQSMHQVTLKTFHAAVYCLEAEGVLRWCYQFHGDFVVIRLNVGDVDADGRPEIVPLAQKAEVLEFRRR